MFDCYFDIELDCEIEWIWWLF